MIFANIEYPDNQNRLERAQKLAAECSSYVSDIADAYNKIQDNLTKSTEELNKLYSLYEVPNPKIQKLDLGQYVTSLKKLEDDQRTFLIVDLVIDGFAALGGTLAMTHLTPGLARVLSSNGSIVPSEAEEILLDYCNNTSQSLLSDMTGEAAAEGTVITTEATAEGMEIATEVTTEGAEVGTEVAVGLGAKIAAGTIIGVIAIGATIAIDVIIGAIEGAVLRSRLQDQIKNLVFFRARIFLAKKKVFILNSAIESVVGTVKFAQTTKNPLISNENVPENVKSLVEEALKNYQAEWKSITYEECVNILHKQDEQDSAWTNDDPILL